MNSYPGEDISDHRPAKSLDVDGVVSDVADPVWETLKYQHTVLSSKCSRSISLKDGVPMCPTLERADYFAMNFG